MTAHDLAARIEEQIAQWRRHVRQRRSRPADDELALEDRLRAELSTLAAAGLDDDEAMLVALRRVGARDTASAALACDYAERFRDRPADTPGDVARARREALVAFGFAVGAAVAVKLPELFGLRLEDHEDLYARNMSLFVFPLLAAWFVWKRAAATTPLAWLVAGFGTAAVFANMPAAAGSTYPHALTAVHLPVALWLLVGVAHAGGRWADSGARMEFIRFTGELFIHYVLIALGGIVLTGFLLGLFEAVGIDLQAFFQRWILPCCALGAIVVGAWLVETRARVAAGLAPMLTRLFTPLFTLVLVALLATMAVTGRGFVDHRNLLIAIDLLLVVVLGLHVYAVSARDPLAPGGAFDVLQTALVACALLVDVTALWAMGARVAELGVTPNRAAALGLNAILLANLAGSGWRYVRFLRGRGGFAALERWQTRFPPVYAAWAAVVVVVFPRVF